MKAWGAVMLAIGLVLVCGCYPQSSRSEKTWPTDAELVRWPTDVAICNGIIRQHTLFPYHFVDGAAPLNELGQHDLAVLAAHYKQYPGNLNVRRGDANEVLYQARVKTVLETLTQAGVEAGRIQVAEDLPGGEGMPSENVVNILKETEAAKTRPGASGTSGAESREPRKDAARQ